MCNKKYNFNMKKFLDIFCALILLISVFYTSNYSYYEIFASKYVHSYLESADYPFPNSTEFITDDKGEIYISKEEALIDYEIFWKTIEENFPFFDEIERKFNIDLKSLRISFRKRLDQISEMNKIRVTLFRDNIIKK